MYIIISYDVNNKTCNKVMKILREKLFHIHNSVFEGEITHNSFLNLKDRLSKVINNETDRVIFYILPSDKCLKYDYLGVKQDNHNIII